MNKRMVILTVMVLAVWGVIWAVKFGPEPESEEKSVPWPRPSAADTERIEIRGAKGDFSLVRGEDGGWLVNVSGPPFLRANMGKVSGLLNFIAVNKPKRDLGDYDREKAEDFGLGKGRHEIRVVGPEGFDIALGGENPAGDGVYALFSGAPDTLFLLDASYLAKGLGPASSYYDLRPFALGEDAVRDFGMRYNLDGRSFAWTIEKNGDRFAFVEPVSMAPNPVSPDARFFLRSLLDLKAEAPLPGMAVPNVAPVLTAFVRDKDRSETMTLYADPAVPGDYVGNSTWQPVPFQIGGEAVRQMARDTFDLRDRSVVDLDTSAITGFTISQDNRTLTAHKTGTGWKKAGDGKDILGIDMTLWRLTDLKFAAEPSVVLPEKVEPAMFWRLMDSGNRTVAEMAFYSDPDMEGELCWLKVSGKESYFPVSNQILKDLRGQLPPRQ